MTIPKEMIEKKDVPSIEECLESQFKTMLSSLDNGAVLLILNSMQIDTRVMRAAFSQGRFTHAAVFLKSGFLTPSQDWSSKPLLWQASGEKINDDLVTYTDGPDLHLMSRYLAHYMINNPNSRFVVRNLKKPLTPSQGHDLRDYICQTIQESTVEFCTNFQLPYIWLTSNMQWLHWLDNIILGPAGAKRSKLTFCSRLVTDTFKHIGVLSQDINSSSTNPNFFARPFNNDTFEDKEYELDKHTIVLIQPEFRKASRTFIDYESVDAALEGICFMYEAKLKSTHPHQKNITYDISQLFKYLDDIPDLSCLIYTPSINAYTPYNKEWIKNKIMVLLQKMAR
ncbi:hypothetical protein SAMD00019534_029760 [Acytostelium subglobosum LB1]|uniref:hypothetical protein n=1 Tax=Acytostelium subglobosum LB1 TaxID=1410327 RepID=UPI000644CFB9|nr:hypothetical protein SAMD00019534_029760 [Acytostelium subglobosum LB1]GAM19801.1 hypothetical protein SAMD00019534_029760 [Acytostelium subglobosum LB1]|eukprot:XP_012756563.1 hypothetical protein SAMD00019534_029760 [Acytostelium subglobosum LB1]